MPGIRIDCIFMLKSVDKYQKPMQYFSQVSFQIQIGSSNMTVSFETCKEIDCYEIDNHCYDCTESYDDHCEYCTACPEQDCCEKDDLLLDN